MTEILKFYNNELNISKHTHDLVLKSSDFYWEGCHDFIQFVFPTNKPSAYCKIAPLVTKEDIASFKDNHMQCLLWQSFDRFIKFLGIAKTKKSNPHYFEIINFDAFNAKVLTPGHNLLRITRLFESIKLLGYKDLKHDCIELHRFLVKEMNIRMCEYHRTVGFWNQAI